ncbi:protein kinase [bacterium]|nr:protein kinase [bacterium]
MSSAEIKQPEVVSRVTLLMTDLVNRDDLMMILGEERANEIFEHHDRTARALIGIYLGREINKSRGFLFLFERPIDAVRYALRYHESVDAMSEEMDVTLSARVGIHTGEAIVRENPPDMAERTGRLREIEGEGRRATARMLKLAERNQTLLSEEAFEEARAAAVGEDAVSRETRWMYHGLYQFPDHEKPLGVYEVGAEGMAPLEAPESPDAEQLPDGFNETLPGWRPTAGESVPAREGWTLERELGTGGFDEAWLARHEKGARRVFRFCFGQTRLRALRSQAKLFRLLKERLGNRTDVLSVRGWHLTEPPYFLETDYYEGCNLREWAQRRGGLEAIPIEERVELIARIAETLAAVHGAGILHRNLKPMNIIAIDNGHPPQVLLTDFGLGTIIDRELESGGIADIGSAIDQFLDDTPEALREAALYRAPELEHGHPANPKTDMYSLGVLFFQILAGDLNAQPINLETVIADDVLRGDVSDLIATNPAQRPNARDLAESLRKLPERRKKSGTRSWVEVGGLALWAAVLIVAAVLLFRGRGGDEEQPAPPPEETPIAVVQPTPAPTPAPAPMKKPEPTPEPRAPVGMQLGNVFVNPYPPMRGEEFQIRFRTTGTPLENAEEVFIHRGRNAWADIVSPDQQMERVEDNVWEVLFTIELGTEQIDFAFHNGEATWANNFDRDWHLQTFSRFADPPPPRSPFVMDGKLDPGACIVGSAKSPRMWIGMREGWLYVAADAPLDYGEELNCDAFIMISGNTVRRRESPWQKSGYVADFQYFLAREGDNEFVGWYPITDNLEENAVADDPTRFMSARDGYSTFFEGTIRAAGVSRSQPLFVALGVYGPEPGGELKAQAPEPRSQNLDVDTAEYFQITGDVEPCDE